MPVPPPRSLLIRFWPERSQRGDAPRGSSAAPEERMSGQTLERRSGGRLASERASAAGKGVGRSYAGTTPRPDRWPEERSLLDDAEDVPEDVGGRDHADRVTVVDERDMSE